MASVELVECITLAEGGRAGQPRVDREAGIIYGVKVLGWSSLNGREYDPAGVDPKLYEGRKVCADHVKPGQARSTRDTIAWLSGCTKQATGIYAEQLRLLNPKGEFEQRLMTAAESAPHLFGLSHTANGRAKAGSNGSRIEAVESVNTVDIVDDPATVSGFYESRSPVVKKKVKELVESLKSKRPGYSRALREMAEAGIMSPDASMDAPAEEPGDEGEKGDHKQALRDACKAILDDEALTPEDMVKKIKDVLKMIHGKAGPAETETEDDAEGSDASEESNKRKAVANLHEEVAKLKARDLLRTAADDAGVKLPKRLLESIKPTITAAEAKELVAELKGVSHNSATRAQSAAPAIAKQIQEAKLPENADAKATAQFLLGR